MFFYTLRMRVEILKSLMVNVKDEGMDEAIVPSVWTINVKDR